jgi:hypothetical protein
MVSAISERRKGRSGERRSPGATVMRWQNRELAMTERRTVLSKDAARQAVTGHNARYVLGFGLAGVVVAFVVIYAIYFGI